MRPEAATTLSSAAIPTIAEKTRSWGASELAHRFRKALVEPSVRNGLLAVTDQAVVSATNFATSVIIGRLCDRQDLGVYYLALSMFYFVRGIQEQIVSAPYMVYCNRQRDDSLPAYGGSSLAHQAVLAVATVLCLIGIQGILSLGYGPQELRGVTWVLLGAVPFMLLRDHIRHLMFARFQVMNALLADSAIFVLQVGSLLLLGFFDVLHVESVYGVMGLACAVASFGFLLSDRNRFRIEPKRLLSDWRLNWGFGKWALAGQLVGCSTPYILPWIVSAAKGNSETGMLAACSTLIGVANMFLIGMWKFTGPKAIHAYTAGGLPRLRSVLWKTATLFIVTLGGLCLLLALTGDSLAVLVYGDEYRGAGPVMLLLALGLVANSISMTAGNGLWAVERPAANFRADICALVIAIAASAVFLPHYGALGAALAMFLGVSGGAAVRCWILFRVFRSLEPTVVTT